MTGVAPVFGAAPAIYSVVILRRGVPLKYPGGAILPHFFQRTGHIPEVNDSKTTSGSTRDFLRWPLLFFLIVVAYCGYYAPFGINETDGGFLTGLAWQVLSGKTLYADVVYVRPPLPVWLRALELYLLPDDWAILGERWIFYLKVALYSWIGAAVLARGACRWQLAAFAFVLSVHCYPPAAWHTVDGLLFGALAIWCRSNVPDWRGGLFAGLFLVAMLLCKQSFYPMVVLLLLPAPLLIGRRVTERETQNLPGGKVYSFISIHSSFIIHHLLFLTGLGVFVAYLFSKNLLSAFWEMTTSATSSGQAVQHGVLDYFRIQPALAALTVVFWAPAVWFWWKNRGGRWAFWGWVLWLVVLVGSYAWVIAERREFTVPFAQTRLLFWVAAGYAAWQWRSDNWDSAQVWRFGSLLALCWCASVSWGYNLPVLFAVPWAYAALKISRTLFAAAYPTRRPGWWSAAALVVLLALFRWGYEWVYRDGPRAAMTEHLGAVFPRLSGIYSSPETAAQYRELADLIKRYGPNFKTLPAFPHANFITNTRPPLPLDWVVEREMGVARALVETEIMRTQPVCFIEKAYVTQLDNDHQLALTKSVFNTGRIVEETPFFWVVSEGARPSGF